MISHLLHVESWHGVQEEFELAKPKTHVLTIRWSQHNWMAVHIHRERRKCQQRTKRQFLRRALTAGLEYLDQVELDIVFHTRAFVMKNVPFMMKGVFRVALTTAMGEVLRDMTTVMSSTPFVAFPTTKATIFDPRLSAF